MWVYITYVRYISKPKLRSYQQWIRTNTYLHERREHVLGAARDQLAHGDAVHVLKARHLLQQLGHLAQVPEGEQIIMIPGVYLYTWGHEER